MMDEMLSIIIPVYNGERYLQETLHSIINSTYRDIEIIIIDDGSKDNSREIYTNICEKDKRVRVIIQENEGIVGARNRGIKEARGKYICFCDQDDIVAKDFYTIAISKMKRDDSDICISSTAKFIDNTDDNNQILYENLDDELFVTQIDICNNLIKPMFSQKFDNSDRQMRMTIWNCIIKKAILDQKGLFFKRFVDYEDDMLMRFDVLLNATKVTTIKYCGYYWRVNPNSESHRKKYISDMAYKQRKMRIYLKEEISNKGLKQEAQEIERYQVCIDVIKILTNEIATKRRGRKKYLSDLFDSILSDEIIQVMLQINKRELRYRVAYFWIRKKSYWLAYLFNYILVVLIDILSQKKLVLKTERIVSTVSADY